MFNHYYISSEYTPKLWETVHLKINDQLQQCSYGEKIVETLLRKPVRILFNTNEYTYSVKEGSSSLAKHLNSSPAEQWMTKIAQAVVCAVSTPLWLLAIAFNSYKKIDFKAMALALGTSQQALALRTNQQALMTNCMRPLTFKQHITSELQSWQIEPHERGERRREAVGRILFFLEKNNGVLDLHGLRLTTLPPCIFQQCFNKIKFLNLATNDFITLPPEIVLLQNLETLNLTGNRIVSLFPEIGQLQALRDLSLGGNLITSLPSEIVLLQNLETLNLTGNRIVSLSPEITQLRALRRLSISHNQLTNIPVEIGQLQALKTLDLTNNPLTGAYSTQSDHPFHFKAISHSAESDH